MCAQQTLVEQSIPELLGTSYFQGPPRWGWVGELPGSAEGKGDSEFILNPSGHWSCKQADNSLGGGGENQDWQPLRHLPGSLEAAQQSGPSWRGRTW
jgi:hypothetical protein